ncbi:putative quinol monooxygenase [Butyrivibrio sp. VCD2006]|uniref:putative quinol monooxygenase n=1 Tax=Butyrivibrio sp. VCD2006 TaxID=1280664 RepID=UPI000413496E|nr:putative quinol monooxygenase [Butyrivibrio sp. VCD2006]
MIVLNVTYKCKAGKRNDFLDVIQKEGIDEASRAEEGNVKYEYYLPVADSDEVLLVEKWQNADAITQHGQQPHYKRLGELKADFVVDTIIERFEV